jgi:hypothetical protein
MLTVSQLATGAAFHKARRFLRTGGLLAEIAIPAQAKL